MFAVIRTGGKQYRVAPNDIIEIERIAGEPGDIIELGDVLLLGGGDGAPKAGSPAITGALVIGTLTRFKLGKLLFFVQALVGALICSFALSRSWPLSCALLFLTGIAFMMVFSTSFSLVQMTVPDALRGRVVSIYMVALRSGWPLGSFLAGSLAVRFSTPNVLAFNGALLCVIALGLVASGRGRSLRQI